VIGFTFGVVQMGLYAFYRNATPRLPAKEAPDDKEASVVPEHVVTVAKLGVELKSCDVCPIESPQMGEATQPKMQGRMEEKGSNAV
jgi:solute carrier family 50 (sugar transporter)